MPSRAHLAGDGRMVAVVIFRSEPKDGDRTSMKLSGKF